MPFAQAVSAKSYEFEDDHPLVTHRDREGMDRLGLFSGFAGSLVHDFLSSYYRFDCAHFLCAAHLLRELVYLHEEMDQPWAADMIALLREAKKLRDRDRNRPPGARRASMISSLGS